MTGPYAYHTGLLITCNVVAPQCAVVQKVRSSPVMLFIWSIIVLVGMWLERFVIIVSSLAQDTALVVGHLPGHALGLGHLLRHHRTVPVPVLPVHSPAADDFDF